MAPSSKSNLMKAAHEGFAMLDEYFDRKKGKAPSQPPVKQHDQYMMNMYQRQPQKPHVYQVLVPVPEAKAATATIDCYAAAKLFNGTVIVDYPNTNKLPVRRYG